MLQRARLSWDARRICLWGDKIREHPDRINPAIGKRFLNGENFTAQNALKLEFHLQKLRKEYLRQTSDYDFVVGPTQPQIPPEISKLETDTSYYIEMALMSISLTRLANLLGLCATTQPVGSALGFPVGLMIMAPPFQENKLLRCAMAVETLLNTALPKK
ncbi:amidase family protein [Sneathiella glossodoripedis]|uniref:amidase family protein n=1 Tax=Sneathiella glossodoripedis TaxID=418853 RepID=UPI0009FC1E58|nr:amidase family protein [Sneathiella glossodoripedis]